MSQIERVASVTLHYRIGLTDDHVSRRQFRRRADDGELGQGEMAEGLELALLGLRAGDEQTIDIGGPDLAFGYVDETIPCSSAQSNSIPISNSKPA